MKYSNQSGYKFPWGNSIILEKNEKPILWINDVIDPNNLAAGKGILVLTNLRLIYLTRSLPFSKYSIHDAFNLEDVFEVVAYKVKNSILHFNSNKYIRIKLNTGAEKDFTSMEIYEIVPQINQAIQLRKNDIAVEKNDIRFNSNFKEAEKPKINEKIKCKYCGCLNDTNNLKCECCGAPLE